MKAQQMFEKLGFKLTRNDDEILSNCEVIEND